ncbi:unnamed protein product [Effrenium voratum]|nr:unnamed protein product [Effrenium voratum]
MQGGARSRCNSLTSASRRFGGLLPDGRGVLADSWPAAGLGVSLAATSAVCASQVVLDDFAADTEPNETEAFADLLLQCTAFDASWDETDEWNEFTLSAVHHLQELKAEERISRAEAGNSSSVRAKAATLRRRLAGERGCAAPKGPDPADVPMMLSMNTRVQCPVCMTMQPDLLRCPTCRNVGYCSAEHLQADAGRHKFWCSQDVKGPK